MKKISLLIALLASTACASSVRINHASAPTLAPNEYKTYTLVDRSVGHEGADGAIASAVHSAMGLRGYEHSSDESADLLVNFKVLTVGGGPIEAAEARDGLGAGADTGSMMGMAGGAVGFDLGASALVDSRSRIEKLVLIQLHEGESMRTVWVGWAQAEVDQDDLEVSAVDAARQILRRVPRRG